MQSPKRMLSPFTFFNTDSRRIDADPFVDTKSETLISDTSHTDDGLDFSDRFVESMMRLVGNVEDRRAIL